MPCFIADDKFFDVVRVLEARGWRRLNVEETNGAAKSGDVVVDLRWRNLSATKFVEVQPGTLVNHFEGSQCLSNKGKLTRLLAAAEGGLGAASFPRCHALALGGAVTTSTKPSLREEAALTVALEDLMRDMGTQLAVGALRRLDERLCSAGEQDVAFEEVRVDGRLFLACVGVAERWAEQLTRALRSGNSSVKGGGDTGRRRIPGRGVLSVGSEAWDQLLASGGSVQTVATALCGGHGSERTLVAAAEVAPRVREVLRRLAALDTHFVLGGGGVWIVKPSGQSCGRGIVCKDSVEGVAAAVAALEFKAVVQKYIERPLLVWGRKFDIRLWVLVTAASPSSLCVWGFSDCYLRLSSRAFSLCDLNDRMVHLCNFSVQKESKEGGGGGCASGSLSPAADGPSDGPVVVDNMASSRAFAAWVDGAHGAGSWAGLVGSMRALVLETLLAARAGITRWGRGFEWLGFDVMVAAEGSPGGGLRAFLIEVNTSPDVSHSTPVTAALVPAATEDLCRLLLDEGHAGEAQSAAGGAASGLLAPLAPHRRVDSLFAWDGAVSAAVGGAVGGDASAAAWAQVEGFPETPCWQLWYAGDGDGAAPPPAPPPASAAALVASQSTPGLGAPFISPVGGPAEGGPPGRRDPPPPRSLRDLTRLVPALKAAPSTVAAARSAATTLTPPPAAAPVRGGCASAQTARAVAAATGGRDAEADDEL